VKIVGKVVLYPAFARRLKPGAIQTKPAYAG